MLILGLGFATFTLLQHWALTSFKRLRAGVVLKGGREVAADLVVDASGRNSKLPQLLRAAGRPPAAEVEVSADISYSMRIIELPESVRVPKYSSSSMLVIDYVSELPV